MAKKYVKSMKFSQSGEIYYVRDAEAKERLDALEPTVAGKQDALVSGVNIKTINDIDILGSGNIVIGGGEPGTGNYNDLSNKPSIGGTTLAGDKTLVELGIASASDLAGKANASDLTDHTSDTNIHVTSEEKLSWSGKQNALDSNQLAAANSGITSSKVLTYDGYASGKQDTLVSGTNIKTINGKDVLGSGDLEVEETVTITPNRDEGGFVSGTTYTDLTFQEFAETLLCPYQAPEATITVSPAVCHKGSSNTIAVTLKATKKSKPLTSATWKIGSGSATAVAALVPDGGTSNQSATGINAATTFTFEVQDGKSTITKTATVAFNDYRYHGLVDVAPANVTETIIKSLTTDLTGTKGYTYSNITMTNRRVCYAYPASYGDISTIIDGNGYTVTTSYTKTTVSVDGVNYNVYTMTSTGTLSNGQMKFS